MNEIATMPAPSGELTAQNKSGENIQITPIKVSKSSTSTLQPEFIPAAPSLDTASPQASADGTPPIEPGITQNTSTPEANNAQVLNNIVEDIKNTRDDTRAAVSLVREYRAQGGSLDQLKQQFAATPELASPESPFSPELADALDIESSREQYLLDNQAAFINAGNSPEDVQQKIEEYVTEFQTTPVDLLKDLESKLSADQKAFLEQQIEAKKQERKQRRFETVQNIAQELGNETSSSAIDAINTHPEVFSALGIAPGSSEHEELLAALSSVSPDSTPQTPPSAEQLQDNKITGEKLALFAVFLVMDVSFNRGRYTEELFQDMVINPLTRKALGRMGFDEEQINKFLNYGKSSEQIYNLSSENLVRVLENFDRYQVIDFLNDLDDHDRSQLLSGADRKLHPNDIQRLILNKLRPNDLKKLGIEQKI